MNIHNMIQHIIIKYTFEICTVHPWRLTDIQNSMSLLYLKGDTGFLLQAGILGIHVKLVGCIQGTTNPPCFASICLRRPGLAGESKAVGTFLSLKIGYWRLEMVGCPLPWSFARAYSLPFMPTLWWFVIDLRKSHYWMLVLLTFLERFFAHVMIETSQDRKTETDGLFHFQWRIPITLVYSSYCQDISNGGEGGDEAVFKDHQWWLFENG